MKKNLLLFSFFILSVLNINAAHIIGGDFNVKWIEGNTFEAEVKLFRDCFGGGAAFDPTITISVYDDFADTLVMSFDISNPVITPIILGDECYTPTQLCVEQGVYTQTVELPDNEEGYYLAWERCCRNSIITNLAAPDDEGMVFVCYVADPALQNSSPVFDVYPSTGYFCIDTENILNFNVTDADGDSLAYFFDNPLSGDATSSTNPTSTLAGPSPYSPCLWAADYSLDNILNTTIPMTIDVNTGTISVVPEQLGVYVFAVYVAEFRNGAVIGAVRREIQFQTVVCTVDYPPAFTLPAAGDTMYEVIAETFFQLPVIVEDQNASDPILITAESELFDLSAGNSAWFESEQGNGTLNAQFNWLTGCVNISNRIHEVTLKSFSDGCSGSDTAEFKFYVKVIPDIDGGIVDNAPNVITPNRDGINEYFSLDVTLNPCFDTFQVYIYDRWGNKVFETNDPLFQWYGQDMFTSNHLNEGVYFYVIDATFQDYIYRKTSSISLLR